MYSSFFLNVFFTSSGWSEGSHRIAQGWLPIAPGDLLVCFSCWAFSWALSGDSTVHIFVNGDEYCDIEFDRILFFVSHRKECLSQFLFWLEACFKVNNIQGGLSGLSLGSEGNLMWIHPAAPSLASLGILLILEVDFLQRKLSMQNDFFDGKGRSTE